MIQGYWFKSDLFEIQAGEDKETNPGCYGKALAEWLSGQLKEYGYEVEEVIPEDWGWCVMCNRQGYLLWVGCGAVQSEEELEKYNPDTPPNGTDVVWHVFPHIEVPIFYLKSFMLRLLGRLDVKRPVKQLEGDLQKILADEPGIGICDEP